VSKDDVEDLCSSRGYASPGCPICPVCGVPSMAMHDGDLCMGCGADIFAMVRDNRERAMARSRIRRYRRDFISGVDDRRQDNA